MGNSLLSVGLDVGTTTTQLIFSRLTVTNRASSFCVPMLAITDREILYKSHVHFTPLLRDKLVDGPALCALVLREYEKAGIRPSQVDTGAVIVTGETSRKENAREVLEHLSSLAGDFVVTTAGPDLESELAAKGAGAAALSETTEHQVLHMDIGGGTSNLALLHRGKVLATGCLNVGGRLIKLEKDGTLQYVSPEVSSFFPYRPGDRPGLPALKELAEKLAKTLEMAAGLLPADPLLDALMTREAIPWLPPREQVLLSFSGGVADCIGEEHPPFAYGDIGPLLGQAIRKSRLCRQEYHLGRETIRATVIGAGCHSTQLSGSTVFFQNITFPLKNLPVRQLSGNEAVAPEEFPCALAMEGFPSPSYRDICRLADKLAANAPSPLIVCLQRDMAKVLGQALSSRLGREKPILCLDGLHFPENSFLDVGVPVGPALPVVVKTLVFER